MNRKKLLNKVLSMVMAATILMGGMSFQALAERENTIEVGSETVMRKNDKAMQDALEDGLILDLSFDNNSLASNVGQATANGTITYADGVSGKAAVLNGNAGYIQAYGNGGTPLLNGLNEYSVSFWVKAADAATSWWFYSAPNTNTQSFNQEKYAGILSNTVVTYERYNNSSSRPSNPSMSGFTANTWTHVAVTNSANLSTLYVNGEPKATVDSSVNLADMLGTASVTYIGHAKWGNSGEFARGVIDDYKVYSRVLSEAEVEAAYSEHLEDAAFADLSLPGYLTDNYKLPMEIKGCNVTWESSVQSVLNGFEIVADSHEQKVVLTAQIGSKTKTFQITILPANSKMVYAYTRTKPDQKRGRSMHLAMDIDGTLTQLNFNLGVLYAPALHQDDYYASSRNLKNPWIFRLKDGSMGVVAQYITSGGTDQAVGKLAYWTTTDLVNYEYKGLVSIGNEEITAPQVSYDSEAGGYNITWKNGSGQRESFTSDWKAFSAPVQSTRDRLNINQGISDATVTCEFLVTSDEAAYLGKKLIEVKNTTVDSLEQINVKVGETVSVNQLPQTLRAHYTDTSTGDIPIDWDMEKLNAIDWDKEGTYTVTGQAAVKDYPFPSIHDRADPAAIKFDGKYYFIATRDNGQQTVFNLRSADTLEDLANAAEVTLLSTSDGTDYKGCFWAPELHVINGKLSILAAISANGKWDDVQCHIITLDAGKDPMVKTNWNTPQRILRTDGSDLVNKDGAKMGISLDMTYLEDDGNHYYLWSARYTNNYAGTTGDAHIAIAKFDPSDPTRLITDPVIMSRPDFGWENASTNVDEGPYALKHNGRIFLTISGSGTDSTYAVGLLEATPGTDLTDVANWEKTGYPILAQYHVPAQPGPGHNSFVKDEYGRDVLVFHSGTSGTGRDTGFRTVHYGFDGAPILYMTADRYLKAEYRTVKQIIKVSASYTVALNANGGAVSPTSLERKGGEEIGTLPNPTRSAHSFKGWYTEAVGGTIVTAATKVNGNMVVYAHWEPTGISSDQKKADEVIAKIAAIGSVQKSSGAAIKAAEDAYNSLNAEQKKLVTNYKVLTEARVVYEMLASVPKKGSKHTVGKYRYQVTKSAAKGGTVQLLNPVRKTMKKAAIPAKIQLNDYTYEVTSIAAKAFQKNKKLTAVTIEKNVREIGKQTFAGCSKLKSITIKTTKLKKNSIGKNALKGIKKNATIRVPKKKFAQYKKLFNTRIGYRRTMKLRKG